MVELAKAHHSAHPPNAIVVRQHITALVQLGRVTEAKDLHRELQQHEGLDKSLVEILQELQRRPQANAAIVQLLNDFGRAERRLGLADVEGRYMLDIWDSAFLEPTLQGECLRLS